jgi:hypothetical protein
LDIQITDAIPVFTYLLISPFVSDLFLLANLIEPPDIFSTQTQAILDPNFSSSLFVIEMVQFLPSVCLFV